VARRLERPGRCWCQADARGHRPGRQLVRRADAQPVNAQQGSSGSSAGSASSAVAGLVGFALGSETLGSIVSRCSVCGASGLRPTFGRVSRHGCMTLAWTMDKGRPHRPLGRGLRPGVRGDPRLRRARTPPPSTVPSPGRRSATCARCGSATSRRASPPRTARPARAARPGCGLVAIKLPDKQPLGPCSSSWASRRRRRSTT